MTKIEALPDHRSLDDLRREIDEIDAQMHTLLMRRADLVTHVAHAKAMTNKADNTVKIPVRPDREMAIMRALMDRHSGPLPSQVVVRIWREIINAMSQMQAAFSVRVADPTGKTHLWDLARDFFGSITPMSLAETPQNAITDIVSGLSTFAVVPEPRPDDSDPWWPLLTQPETNTLHIIGRLPVIGETDRAAVIIAPKDLVPIDPDVHYVVTKKPLQMCASATFMSSHGDTDIWVTPYLADAHEQPTEAYLAVGGYFLGPQG